MSPQPSVETRVAERFKLDTVQHQLTVLHDDGLYRHFRFMDPESSHHWFDLITWPGSLAIKGDMGSYTFSRTQDMLDFFRRSAWDGGPNLQYWEEKLDAADARSGVREYSEELLRQHIETGLAALADDDLAERLRVRAEDLGTTSDRLPATISDECRTASAAYMAGLREELDDDLTGDFPTWCIEDEGDALAGLRQFEYRPDGAPYSEQPFTFDPTEWDVRDWAWHYVWCCHAIVWGIAAYDRANAEKPAPVLVAAPTA